MNSDRDCRPRWATSRTERRTLGPAVGEAARAFGQPLLPWQQQVADVGLEIDDDGKPAYREVIFSTPRQSGKTTLILAWQIQRAVGWARMLGEPQKMIYTAQDASAARRKLLQDQIPMLEPHKARLGIRRFYRGAGAESIVWANGSRLDINASTEQSGHGNTLDLGVKDELWNDKDNRRDQAMGPAMLTRAFAQKLTASTMGTHESIAWNGKVTLGRAAVEAGKTGGIAYFEWSADPNIDVVDPDNWWSWMPALGHTQSPAAVQHELDEALAEGKLGEWMRALGNIPTGTAEQVIPAVDWDIVNAPTHTVDYDQARAFAVDCNPERSWAGICVADEHAIEVVDRQAGTGWVVARAKDLHDTRRLPAVVDGTGPAATFIPALEAEGITVITLGAREVAAAAGKLYDDIVNHTVKIRRDPDLDTAVAAANKRSAGDAWAFGRKNSTGDISLLVAATNAHWHATKAPIDVVANVW